MNICRKAICLFVLALICWAKPLIVFGESRVLITSITAPISQNANHDTAIVRPGTVLEYPLTSDMFAWSADQTTAPVTLSQLRQGDITVKYSGVQSRIIEDISLDTTTYNGQTTACVKVEFADELFSVEKREFRAKIYLAADNKRVEVSEITLTGDFENEEITVDSGDDYADLSDGKVLAANDYIANLEIYMGGDVLLYTRVSSGQKYYAAAKNEITDADDAMLTKYPGIETAVRLTVINLKPTGKCVSLKDIGDYHIYDARGAYLGKTSELVSFSPLYYLVGEKIDMSGAATGDPNASADKSLSPFGGTPEEKAAKEAIAGAAEAAAQSGSDTANVSAKNVESISSAELEAMYNAAALAEMKTKYTADTTTANGSVQGRIEINPALAVNLNKDILLGVSTSGTEADRISSIFKRFYSNRLCVIYLSHAGSYGMKVKIAAKINMDNLNMNDVFLYRYDSAANSFKPFPAPEMFIDQNGYLHFDTIYGGGIIVSEGPLSRRV
jgi:hypothetical protein